MKHTYKATIEIELTEELEDSTEINTKEGIDNIMLDLIKNKIEDITYGEVKVDLTYSNVDIIKDEGIETN